MSDEITFENVRTRFINFVPEINDREDFSAKFVFDDNVIWVKCCSVHSENAIVHHYTISSMKGKDLHVEQENIVFDKKKKEFVELGGNQTKYLVLDINTGRVFPVKEICGYEVADFDFIVKNDTDTRFWLI